MSHNVMPQYHMWILCGGLMDAFLGFPRERFSKNIEKDNHIYCSAPNYFRE